MIDWTNLPTQQLVEHYALANTPTYLYERFRQDSTVKALASRYTISQLTDGLRELLGIKHWTAQDVARAYACLIALSHHDLAKVKDALRQIELTRLRWAYQILALIEAGYKKTAYFFVPYTPSVNEPRVTSTSSSTSIVRLNS